MNKIKEFWQNNRVLFILSIIVIVCLIIILIVAINNFYAGNDTSEYGQRLDGIEDVPITEKFINETINTIKENEQVKEMIINTQGKIVYTRIEFNDEITLLEAQGIALSIIEMYSEEELAFYDLNFTLIQESSEKGEGFFIEGVKTINGNGLTWNNNYPVNDDEEDGEE